MSYEELKKICGKAAPGIDDIFDYDEEEQIRIVKDYINEIPHEEKVGILENARKKTIQKYGIKLPNDGEDSPFEKLKSILGKPSKEEELSDLLKEAFAYTYVLGKEKPLRNFYDNLKKSLGEVTDSLGYKTYVENLEEGEYTFYERLDQVLNGEGAKFFEEDERPIQGN